ncbi:ABC transporter ATP-binding protein [Consotaella aegiceratis]|uniref:ABC transporter ATP-binding protein n=1 Tax=Consotaella aegiceratis TaxID=3097961 RepID=UPI002F3ECDAB
MSLRDLRVAFKAEHGRVHAVNGVDLDLAPGEALGLLGESGSGKSITLRAIMRLLPASAEVKGSIRFAGQEIMALRRHRLRQLRGAGIAMVFQEPMTAMDQTFTVGQQIVEAIRAHESVTRQDARRRALDLLELVQIPSAESRLGSYPQEMSGGMRQRAMIALALACRPKVLLADEPTTALDVTVQIQILLLLRRLQRELGMSMIFVTHDIGAAVEVSDRIAVMYGGRIGEIGTASQIVRSPRHPYSRGLISAVTSRDKGERMQGIPGKPPRLEQPPDCCTFHPRCRFAIVDCRSTLPQLQTVDADHQTACLRSQELVQG